MPRILAVLVAAQLALLTAPTTASAGPYFGLPSGGGGMNILGSGPLFPDLTGPLIVGAGYSSHGNAVVRIGLGILNFHGTRTLARPQWLGAIECLVHLDDPAFVTYDVSFQRGVSRFFVGGSAGIAHRERELATDYGFHFSPEITLPLRVKFRPHFTPAALLFVRVDLYTSGPFEHTAITGLTFAVY